MLNRVKFILPTKNFYNIVCVRYLKFYICSRESEFDSLAQLVEHYTFNVVVLGSSPRVITKRAFPLWRGFFVLITALVVQLDRISDFGSEG